jgi:glutathione S-transferase/GST-like protein
VRQRDPKELEAAIERIPLPERRTAWRKAIYNLFSEEELAESRRRVGIGISMLEEALSQRPWLGSDQYSLADVNGFNLGYALPLSQPDLANEQKTPHIIEWLRKIYERPATKKVWKMGRTDMASRVKILEREPQA